MAKLGRVDGVVGLENFLKRKRDVFFLNFLITGNIIDAENFKPLLSIQSTKPVVNEKYAKVIEWNVEVTAGVVERNSNNIAVGNNMDRYLVLIF